VKDYQDFIKDTSDAPSSKLRESILQKVKSELEPTKVKVFFKLLSIQTFIGMITMLFCPQFELSLTNSFEAFHYFHRNFGHYGCMAICGGIFLGSGAIFASYLLSLSEIRVIKETKYLFNFAISGIAVSSFMLLGAKVYLDVTLIWAISGVLMSIIILEAGRILRTA
jgi:hypothetical protein